MFVNKILALFLTRKKDKSILQITLQKFGVFGFYTLKFQILKFNP